MYNKLMLPYYNLYIYTCKVQESKETMRYILAITKIQKYNSSPFVHRLPHATQ